MGQVATSTDPPLKVILTRWYKEEGAIVEAGEPVCELETAQAIFDAPAPYAGRLHRLRQEWDEFFMGEEFARIDPTGPEVGDEAF